MSAVFCDTSGFFALADPSDRWHSEAKFAWEALVERHRLVTTNYVIVETFTLMQARVGIASARRLSDAIVELAEIVWIDRRLHDAGLCELSVFNQRKLSLADCTSFACMRELHITSVFGFDRHFVERGFTRFTP